MEASPLESLKRQAAASALEYVESGMVLGLGTGSTVAHFLDLLGERLAIGKLKDVVGISTSTRTTREARQAGIDLIEIGDRRRIDLTVDGADEVSPDLDLIKGMGGALLREKMVAQSSDRVLIIVDEGKAVDRLGTLSPLPLEIVDWGVLGHIHFIEGRGGEASIRTMSSGEAFLSDNGNLMLDCRFSGGIEEPTRLEVELQARAGVVESGLFLGIADLAIFGSRTGTREVNRES
ncbi:MAG: ribose-5-phosphate isomerase RpiA [Gemmatimonadetes bacterium]|nr:ribose-5-phosphate isomerase RpiA [Gemmatimonadota bacterium]